MSQDILRKDFHEHFNNLMARPTAGLYFQVRAWNGLRLDRQCLDRTKRRSGGGGTITRPEQEECLFSSFAHKKVACVFTSTASEYLFLRDFEVNLVPGGITSTFVEGMSQHSRRPVFGLFAAAAALFYLDIPHKNSIELRSVGCSLAAF